ncbi:hypothetical protein J2Y46_002569 [Microbacterium sp. BE35]|uniref:hypothetical protein n=1 Tax=Microbacterium sp. BE35 TaxID=2817773 RepID=UPI0028664A83|nr:hypothetical protein [Microbacterium sp. BE35]MDR7189743.1 hypothetical protein [Microbacterium sp. BE35]
MFTASNGVQITDRGGSLFIGSTILFGAGSTHGPALAEYFRAKEDERLGRWRWPENPEYVVYPAPRDGTKQADFDAFVVDEALGASGEYVRADDDGNSIVLASPLTLAARAYFAAHPVRKPVLLQAQEDGTDEWFTIRTYPGDPGDRAHADASAHLLTSQDVPARVIEGGTA